MKSLILIFVAIFFSYTPFSYAKDCSLEGLTNNCARIRQIRDQDRLSIDEHNKLSREDKAKNEKYQSKKDEIQQDFRSAIFRHFGKVWNPEFLAAVTNPKFLELFGKSGSSNTYKLCWPPQKSSSECVERELTKDEVSKVLDTPSVLNPELDFEFIEGSFHDRLNFVEGEYADLNAKKITPEKLAKLQATAEEYFPKLKKGLIDFISSQGLDSETVGRMKTIIETIQFKGYNNNMGSCKGANPNAFYSSLEHSFVLCESMANADLTHLIKVMGHEIAHAIDNKNYYLPLSVSKEDPKVYTRQGSGSKKRPDSSMVPIVQSIKRNIDYPFKKVVDCLEKEYDLVKVEKFKSEEIDAISFKTFAQHAKDEFQSANFSFSNDQTSEALPDWLATEALTHLYITKELGDVPLVQSTFDETQACYEFLDISDSIFHGQNPLPDADIFRLSLDEHPLTKARIEMWYANPIIAKANQCEPRPKSRAYCSMAYTGSESKSSSTLGGSEQ